MEINMKLKNTDLKAIGHTTHEDEGTTTFYCSSDSANIEGIFLRNILEHLGYKITAEDDATCTPSSDFDSIAFSTTLPWREYSEISDDS
jgi:hypothetical protein